MFEAVLLMGILGVGIGASLAAASKLFYVYVDPLVMEVDGALPGANCGGCGLPGCSANAEAIVAGKAGADSCVAGGSELAEAIAAIMGVSIEAKEPDIALPGCTYGVHDKDVEFKYLYDGIDDCRAATLLYGGMKVCDIGCIGLGTCEKTCPFGAITMGPSGLPVVDETQCTGCGACERVCPKHIITLSSVTRRIIREYTTDDCTTPCQRVCPAGINISEYIQQISMGDFHKAVQVIKERNPFPTVIGRICPRPCETECRRNLVDESVAINALKRFASDYEKESDSRILPYKAPETGRKIAVIGGGVAGLSAAFFSARLGHQPTVFEATAQLGGLLNSAIATNRLQMEVLDWDIQGVLAMGVAAETGKALGKDVTVERLLRDGFEAVFLSTGGWDNRLARKAGADIEQPIPDSYLLIDLLKTGTKTEDPAASGAENSIQCKPNVIIVDDGNPTIETINLCRKLGADNVTVLIRNAIENSPLEDSDIGRFAEIHADIIFNAAITRIFGVDNQLSGIEYTDLNSADKKETPVDTLIFAAGRFPELVIVRSTEEGVDSTESSKMPLKWEAIQSRKPSTSIKDEGLFSDIDPITDFSAAIRAISAGRRGAATIHQVMYGIDIHVPDNTLTERSVVQNVDRLDSVLPVPRRIMPLNTESDEVLETGFTHSMAIQEAGRCLRCGLVCYQHDDRNPGMQNMPAVDSLEAYRPSA
ncbi:4Fe-4S dicluster domain-containing protein [Thermodesulfobacteriota bacterium]